MKKIIKIDRNIKHEPFIEVPHVIHVNHFSASALKEFRESFDKCLNAGQEIIGISVDSPGGTVYALFGMLDIIAASPVPVATFTTSKAMSCGAVLLSAGNPKLRFAAPNSFTLIHEVSSGTFGKITDMEIDTDHSGELNDRLMGILDKNCNKEPGYFMKLIHENGNGDVYLDAKSAKKHGIIDKIGYPEFTVEVTQKVSICVK